MWMKLSLRILKISSFLLDPETSNPEIIHGFPQSVQENAETVS